MSADDESRDDDRLATLEKIEAPLRSEEAMFRVFLAVGIAAAPIIAAGLIISPLAGLIVLLFEIGVGIGALVNRWRGRARD
jgi:hypothetical protein